MKVVYYKPTIYEKMKQAIDSRGWDQRIREFVLTKEEFEEFLDLGDPANVYLNAFAGYECKLVGGEEVYQYQGILVRVE